MYKVMHGLAPAYLSELCASSCVEGRTRSSARGDLVVQRTRTKFGGRAFVVAGPAVWNQLPCSVCNSPSLDSFKTALKTFYFTPDINFPFLIFMLLHALYEILCMAPLNRLSCYGALEVIVTLLLLLLLLLLLSAKILSTCRGRRHIVSPRAQLVLYGQKINSAVTATPRRRTLNHSNSINRCP